VPHAKNRQINFPQADCILASPPIGIVPVTAEGINIAKIPLPDSALHRAKRTQGHIGG
jgi:hypothetical protein